MRDYLLQIPQKDHVSANRRLKPAADRNKKSQKPSKKNLTPEFSAHAEDVLGFGSQKDSIDSSSVVENCEENLLDDSSESQDSTGLMTPASSTTTSSISRVQFQPSGFSTEESIGLMTPSSSTITFEAVASSDVLPLMSIITSDGSKSGTGSNSKVKVKAVKEEGESESSVEVDVVLKSLRANQLQVLKAKNMDLQSKRIVDALVNIVVKDVTQLHVERDKIDELMSKKGYLMLLLIILWTLAIFAFLFNSSCGIISSIGAVPT